MTRTAVPRSIRVRGVTYRSPDEARVAADELEHRAESVASDLRYDGKDAEAEKVSDRSHADAERLRGWARDFEAEEASSTEQPPDRPPASRRRSRGSRGGGRSRSSSSGGGGVGEAYAAAGTASAARDVLAGARRVPVAGDAVGSFADLLWTGIGALIAIALVYAVTNERGRGPAAFGSLVGGATTMLARFINPSDPLVLGRSATDQFANTPTTPAPVSPAPASVDPFQPPAAAPGLPGFVRSLLPRSITQAGKTVYVDRTIAPTVDAIATHFGVQVSSGYRSPAQNAAANGAANSDHLSGLAADFVGTPSKLQALYAWAVSRFPYVEPLSQSINHVHISFGRRAGN